MAYNIDFGLLKNHDIGGAFQQGMDRGTQRNALAALGKGDNPQAMNALLSVDPQMGFALQDRQFRQQDMQAKREKEQQEALKAEVAQAIVYADTPEKWDQAVDYLSQKAPGAAAYKGRFEERGRLAMDYGVADKLVEKQPQGFTLGPGAARYDAQGNMVARSEYRPQIVRGPDGQLFEYDAEGEGGGAGGSPAGGPSPTGGATALDGHNPGGIIDGPFARSQPGYQGPNGRFAKFASLEDGENAQKALLKSYIGRGFDTPAKIAQRWAPAGDGANDPTAYARNVAGALRIGVNDRITPDMIDRFQVAQATQENGMYPRAAARGGLRPVGPAPQPKEKPQGTRMSPQEVAGEGLPPGVYYRGTDGIPKRIDKDEGGPTRQQVGVARQKLSSLRAIEGQIGRVERAMSSVEKNGFTGAIGGRMPGALDAESNTFDKAVAGLAPLIRQLTRVPGEGSMSDYEARLSELTLPSRTDTPEGRREALAGMRELLSNIQSGYQELLGGNMPAQAPSAPQGPAGWTIKRVN